MAHPISSVDSALLSGKALVWTARDATGITSAVTHHILRESLGGLPIRVIQRPFRLRDWKSSGLKIGMALWRLTTAEDLGAICEELREIQPPQALLTDRTICIVFLEPELIDCTGIVLESGAQIVVVDVPSLERVLRNLIAPLMNSQSGNPSDRATENSVMTNRRKLTQCKIPLSTRGFHPLTSGLVDRLPWPELDRD